MKLFVLNIKGRGGWCLKIEKRGDVYELNIVNVVVECDVIYVSILYHLCRICKAGQFAGINSPLPPWKVCRYIYFESSTAGRAGGGGDENFTAYGRWL